VCTISFRPVLLYKMGRLSFMQCSLLALIISSVLADWDEYATFVDKLQAKPEFPDLWHKELQDTHSENISSKPSVVNFDCDTTPSANVPSTVHTLRPGDINVVGAMGDSLTAANGGDAKWAIRVLRQYRGHSWSIGGFKSMAEGVTTLPNILRQFNSKLVGSSTIKYGGRDSRGAGFNVAQPGNTAELMPYQARLLVERMKVSKEVDLNLDWKMVTLLIGGNDLCQYCNNVTRYSPENYVSHIRAALDILHQELPRTFVNLVTLFDVTPVANMARGIICEQVHRAICNCAKKEELTEQNNAAAAAYRRGLEYLVNSGRYDTTDHFTVVLQPFMSESDVPRQEDGNPDLSFFAPDCFHWSSKGHAAAATMLWNGMFDPVTKKVRDIGFHTTMKCPHKDQFLATVKNIPK